MSDEWAELRSASGILNGCISAIDGWLVALEIPSGVKSVSYYFLGIIPGAV